MEKAISDEVLAAEREKCQKMEKENQRLKVTLTRQTSAYRELERKIAMLQLGLMKKDIEIEEPIDREALLQKKLDEDHPEAGIFILGVNRAGLGDNEGMCEGRDLPWLQDTIEDDWWGSWGVSAFDVVIIDRQGNESGPAYAMIR